MLKEIAAAAYTEAILDAQRRYVTVASYYTRPSVRVAFGTHYMNKLLRNQLCVNEPIMN